MQYFIADKSHSDYLLRELNKDDFDSLKNYHLDFLKFSNVYGCYKNFKVSEQKLKDFLENQKFETPIITPTTKADEGHDENISKEEIIAQGIGKNFC